jgi:excisionase family DNA binding protein
MALSRRAGLKWHPEGLAAALQRQLAPTGSPVRIRRRRTRRRIVGGWGCRKTPPVCVSMLLTIKELAEQLRIKPATLYSWAAQGKIPCRKIHGLVRFDQHDIDRWLSSFSPPQSVPLQIGNRRADNSDLDRLIASAKREVYTSGHGETRPRSSLIGKGERDGALEA